MSKPHEPTTAKAPKRFAYPVLASVLINNVRQPIQIRNISKTGIQFSSSVHISSNTPIRLTWQDPKVGVVESTLVIVRTISDVKETQFPFCYGSKFVDLENETRKNVNRLVENTEEIELKNYNELLNNVNFETINGVLVNGRAFLRDLLKGSKSAAVIDKLAKELKTYETQSFGQADEISQWIQKLVTQYFHSRILLAVLMQSKRVISVDKLIVDKLQSIAILIAECKKYLETKKVSENTVKESGLKESLNRLIYGRVDLMETFTKRTGKKLEPEEVKKENPSEDTGTWNITGRAGRVRG